MCLTSWLFLQHLYGELRFGVWVNILMFLSTRSLATRFVLRQSFALCFIATCGLVVRLLAELELFLRTKLCFVNLGSGMKIAMFSPENGLISCHGTIKLRPA